MSRERIKVAFLDYSPVFAGAERVLYNMIAHIDRNKYEPLLIFPYPMEHQQRYADLACDKLYLADSLKWWMGSDRWEHPMRGTDFIKRCEFGRRLASIVKKRDIDIVDVNLMRRDVKMWVWATKKFTEAKIIGHFRSQDQGYVAPADAQRLFDMVACVSEFSKMRFQLKGDYTNSTVLYDSVDVDVMKCDKTQVEAKIALGYDQTNLLLVSVGQLSLHKGHDTAIKAFSRIITKFPQARLLIAGGGNDSVVEYYRNLASEIGVGEWVKIPGTQISDIQTVYRAADLTLSLTKVGEGFGLVPYESALIGTAFIAPNFGAVREFVVDGQNGMLVDTNNLDAVTEKIIFALENPLETEQMVLRLQKLVRERLSPQMLADNLDILYGRLTDKSCM